MGDGTAGESCVFDLGILAGGGSARMGTDKAFLLWQGQTMIEHIIQSNGRGRAVRISASAAAADRLRSLSWPVVVDEREEYGPLEGIYRLLLAAETEWTFIAATDLPFVDESLPVCLCRCASLPGSGRGPDIVVPRAGDRIHPLCGLYHRRVISQLEKHRVRALLEASRTLYVDVQELGIDPHMFRNVNTPEQYYELAKE